MSASPRLRARIQAPIVTLLPVPPIFEENIALAIRRPFLAIVPELTVLDSFLE